MLSREQHFNAQQKWNVGTHVTGSCCLGAVGWPGEPPAAEADPIFSVGEEGRDDTGVADAAIARGLACVL